MKITRNVRLVRQTRRLNDEKRQKRIRIRFLASQCHAESLPLAYEYYY